MEKKKNKIKGFTLIEVVIATFVLSLIALGLTSSLLTISKVSQRQNLRWEMLNAAEVTIEEAISGKSTINDHENFEINYNIVEINENLKKIEVTVFSEEIDNEINLVTYYKKEN